MQNGLTYATLWVGGALAIFLWFLPNSAQAATLYWIGAVGGNVSVASNWATANPIACAGTASLSAPTSSDIIVFDPDCDNNATINANLDVAGASLPSGYTGTVTQANGVTVTVGSSNFDQASGTFTGGDSAIDINGNFTLSGGTFTNTSGSLTVSGNWAKTSGTFTSGGSTTVTFDGTGTQTINSGGTDTGSDFQNLTKSNSGTLQLTTNALDIDGTLTISSSTTADQNGQNITVATLDNSGTLLLEGGETFTNTTFDTNSGIVTYDGTSSYTGLAAGDAYYNLTFNGSGGTWTLDAALDVNNALTITAGTLDASTSNYGITLAGDWSNSGSFTERSGTVTFDGSGAQALNGETFYNLTINNSAASPGDTTDIDSSAAVTVSNTLTVTDGQFQPTTASDFNGNVSIGANGILKPDSSASLTLAGNFSNSGTFTANSGTATFDATDTDNTITSGSTSFNNLTFNGSGGAWDLQDAMDVDGTLTITAGTLDLNGKNLTNTGGSFVNNATLRLQGGETLTGFTNDTDTGTVIYDGTTSYASGLNAGDNYYALTFNGSGGSWTLDAALDVNSNLTITAGTLDVSTSNYAITLAGNWDNSGSFTERSGTVTFDGSGAQTLTGETFYNLTINNSAGSPGDSTDVDSSTAVTVSNTLTVTDGQFQPTTASDFNGAVTINTNGILKPDSSATITVAGNWTNNGTFTANSGTVTIDGTDQTLSGTTTFNNLTKSVTSAATLTFPASVTTTISGTATLNGASGQLLSLRSSTSGTAATIANSGTTTVSYLDIKDITLTVSTACNTGCVNSGNNTLWTFPGGSSGSSSGSSNVSTEEKGDGGMGTLYSEDGSDSAPISLEQGTVSRGASGESVRTLVTAVNEPLRLNVNLSEPDLVRNVLLRVAGRVIPITPSDENGHVYGTTLRLVGVVGGTYNYALTADYGVTSRTEYGVIRVRDSLTPHIGRLFMQAYGRLPTKTERQYWEKRVASGHKKTLPALFGAMQWHANKSK